MLSPHTLEAEAGGGDLYELKASLDYTVSSKSVRAIQ